MSTHTRGMPRRGKMPRALRGQLDLCEADADAFGSTSV